jgi:short-subunit dehydrogenase
MPGAFQAVYNGTKAFLDSFSFAIRNELKDTGVTMRKLQSAIANITPAGVLAEQHRRKAQPVSEK